MPSLSFLFPLHTHTEKKMPNGLQTSNLRRTLQSEIALPPPPHLATSTMKQLDPPCQKSENAITAAQSCVLPVQENNQRSTHPSREKAGYHFQFLLSSGRVTRAFGRKERSNLKGMRRGKERVSVWYLIISEGRWACSRAIGSSARSFRVAFISRPYNLPPAWWTGWTARWRPWFYQSRIIARPHWTPKQGPLSWSIRLINNQTATSSTTWLSASRIQLIVCMSEIVPG